VPSNSSPYSPKHKCSNINPWNTEVLKVKVPFHPMFPDFWTSFAVWKVPTLRSLLFLVLLVRDDAWSIDGNIQTDKNRNTQRKHCPSVTLSTTNLTRTDLYREIAETEYHKPTTCTLYYALKCSNYTPTCFEPSFGSSSRTDTCKSVIRTF
jgi:hypothetical protein